MHSKYGITDGLYGIHANSYGFSVSCTDFSYLYGLTGVGAFPYGFFYSRNH